MGYFNTVTVKQYCSKKQVFLDFSVQFKYGNTRMNRYEIGSEISWEDYNSIGKPGLKRVAVDGFAIIETELAEEITNPDFVVFIENDKISSVEPNNQRFDFSQENYVVLAE